MSARRKEKCILSFRISVAADVNSGVFLIALPVALKLKKTIGACNLPCLDFDYQKSLRGKLLFL